MTTRAKYNDGSKKHVPDKPKSFSPQVRDDSVGNAWNSLRDLTNRNSQVDSDARLAVARSNLRARSVRRRFLPDPMFGEPGWEMLLALYVAAQSEARHTVSSLVAASGAPATTATRWIEYLERAGFVERRSNPTDKRVSFILLAHKGRESIDGYLGELIETGIATPRQP